MKKEKIAIKISSEQIMDADFNTATSCLIDLHERNMPAEHIAANIIQSKSKLSSLIS